jgi:hypothetical protein
MDRRYDPWTEVHGYHPVSLCDKERHANQLKAFRFSPREWISHPGGFADE